jgi:hypothetical protein
MKYGETSFSNFSVMLNKLFLDTNSYLQFSRAWKLGLLSNLGNYGVAFLAGKANYSHSIWVQNAREKFPMGLTPFLRLLNGLATCLCGGQIVSERDSECAKRKTACDKFAWCPPRAQPQIHAGPCYYNVAAAASGAFVRGRATHNVCDERIRVEGETWTSSCTKRG